jgi:ketosteroid isomerase-like protein
MLRVCGILRAMSKENVEVIKRTLEAFEQGGLDASLRFYDPEVTWKEAQDEPEAATYRGHDGVRALTEKWLVPFGDLRVEPEEFIDAGDAVVMPYRFRGRERSSGRDITAPETWVFWLRAAKIIEVREYRHKAEALEAVGLSE